MGVWAYLLLTLVPALALVLLTWSAGRRGSSNGLLASCIGLFFLGLLVLSSMLVIQSVLTLALAVIWIWFKPRPRTAVILGAVCFLVPFTVVVVVALQVMRHREELQQEFPIRSVADRLAYEQRHAAGEAGVTELPESLMQPFQELEFYEVKCFQWNQDALHNLHALHSSAVREFAKAQGFGVRRLGEGEMMSLRDPDQRAPVPQPEVEYVPLVSTRGEPIPAPSPKEQGDLHWRGLSEFLSGERLGYVRDANYTVGFEAHLFSKNFRTSESIGSPAWKLARLELVSLLKHERPVVYLSENLPNMEELRDVPTRPVAAFEAGALERLRRKENVVTADVGNRIFMLGAIRATETCLKCHSVLRGELLGAFSYELVPAGGAARATGEAAFWFGVRS